jgi:hypothetical protein
VHIENSGRARHRIAASGVIEIPQFLALEVGLDRRSAVSANLLNSERPRLENEPVDPAKNAARFVELRPLERCGASICVNENLIEPCPPKSLLTVLATLALDEGFPPVPDLRPEPVRL